MLPEKEAYGGWASSGEIDIMEMVGHEPNTVHGTLHYGARWPKNVHTGASFVLKQGIFADDFHVFAIEWEKGQIRWYIDGVLYQTQTKWNSEGGAYPAPFDQPFHLVLNVAVGGGWPGPPNDKTVFPQRMLVDYVRVFQRAEEKE
jgi:beta-glucanase (GH16 family)